MPSVPEELNVFCRPHGLMKKLVKDIEKELSLTNFQDSQSYQQLMAHLSDNFHTFQCHEDIENRYIVGELLPRLPSQCKATLENDMHSDNRISALVALVSDGLQMECSSEKEREQFGERLKVAIRSFTVDFLPHMNEEEEVFLPLLVQYFSEPELRKLTKDVIELHHLEPGEGDGPQSAATQSYSPPPPPPRHHHHRRPSLLDLPPELLLTIFSHLSPRDLCNLSLVHPKLHPLTFDPSLWQHLHPIRWANGHLQFFPPPSFTLEGGGEGGLSQDAVLENDVLKELMSVEGRVNANLRGRNHHLTPGLLWDDSNDAASDQYMEHEARVLQGLLTHLLPRIGSHVQTLDLAHGKAVSNEVVFRMLRLCPNLSYLDLSYTGVSDFAFQGLLSSSHRLWQLSHIDLTGCSLITDTAIQRLAQAISSSSSSSSSCSVPLCCGGGGGGGGGCVKKKRRVVEGEEEVVIPQLRGLILAGCHLVTDVGLRSLAVGGGLPHLRYLDLSGLPNITERGLSDLTSSCPSLLPELLFYCDNLVEGPYATCANGCQNVGLSRLVCCRQNL